MRFREEYLFDRLKHLSGTDIYPFHMPGHKRNMEGYPLEPLYQIDITEIDDFDNLHQPEDILLHLQEKIKSMYGAKESFCLINGSSCGILSAIGACAGRRSGLLLARNSHKSAYHAIFQEELSAHYLYPEYLEEFDLYGGISPKQVERELNQHPDLRTVFLTSPTYEGMILPIGRIAPIVHAHGAVLIVDEAHGAHLRFTGQEAYSAVRQGADLVIQSLHKTLPAPTQTALLHICSERVDAARVRRCLDIYQSSSPSYVLLAGIDECFRILAAEGDDRRSAFLKRHTDFMEQMRALKQIRLMSGSAARTAGMPGMEDRTGAEEMSGAECPESASGRRDLGKLVISVRGTGLDGRELYDILLHKYHLQMEMAGESYVLAILTLMDTQEGFDRLAQALLEIDGKLGETGRISISEPAGQRMAMRGPEKTTLTIYEALRRERELTPLERCCGRMSAEFVTLYPPGSPLIVPGEAYTAAVTERIQAGMSNGLTVQGLGPGNQVFVIK